ncbi:MAG TPA: carboxypeptidase regulatory-like domain-containing protein [Blastocatellia bacterium]|nr:carboxypeptidase regulatory-like domain-containing protein [Blastocatellia bacterium]
MKNTHCAFRAKFLAIWLLCGTGLALAQGTNLGTIRGTVTDPNGSVIANAKVQVTDLETNLSRDFTTDKEGNYEAAGLKSGNYRVSVSSTGFKTSVAEVVLRGGDTARADIKITVGAASETVTITGAEGQLIEKESPTISSALNNQQLIEIPRDSRDIYEFLYLNPDITQGAGGDGSFKFIGGQTYGAAFSLDGQRSNGGIFGEPTQSQPSLETIGEVVVLSKNFTAEYSGIANIRVETKRGTKDVQGSLFYNNKNSALAAWNVQDKNAQTDFLPTPDTPKFLTPSFNLNEAGGSVGGPVPFSRKKTFYLFSYERRWDLAPLQIRASNIPSTPLLSADFRGITDSRKPAVPAAVLPLLTQQELGANTILTEDDSGEMTRRFVTIPQRLLNPIALNVLGYYPRTNAATPFSATNGRLTNYVQNVPSLLTRDLSTLRLDHDFSGKDKLSAVYNYQIRNGRRSLVLSPFSDFGLGAQHQNNHTLSLSYTRIFSDTVVNEARGGFNYQLLFVRANQTTGEFLSGIGFNQDEIAAYGAVVGNVLDTFGHVAFTISPFANIANGGRNTNRNLDQKLYTFGDTLTWITGNHSFKFGADFVLNKATDGFSANRGNPRGLVNYGSTFDAYARFLVGLPPTSVTYLGSTRRGDLKTSNWENGFFVQDDWKLNRKVTLNLGLRYDLITPFIDEDDLMINFDPTTSVNPGFQGRFIIPSKKTIPLLDPRFIAYGVVTADEAGVGRGLVKTDKNNLAPRLGVAWRLTDRDVLRGGYGMFYPTSAAQGMRDALATNGFNQGVTKRNTLGLPGGINPRGITPFSGGTVSVGDPNDFGSLAANAIPFDLQSPRIEQFNATYERELGRNIGVRVSYVGTRQHGLIVGRDLNMLPPNNTPFGILNEDGDRCDPIELGDCALSPADAARRPFPRLGSFLASYGNEGSGHSHAFQVELNRRFAKGLMLSVSYTMLDQKSSGNDSGNSTLGGTLYNQFTVNNDFSRDSFISRHRLIAYGMYELPIGIKRDYGKNIAPWFDAVVGGWDLTWNMFAKSGTGFTPYWQCDNCSDVVGLGNIGSDFLDAIGDFNTGATYRPLVVGDPYAGLSGNQFFNAKAFALPPTGADLLNNPAVARRNFLTGPGSWGVNLGVHKNFALTEKFRLQVGADFNNVFNHPLWSPLGSDIGKLGEFFVSLDPNGNSVILPENVIPNNDFGRNTVSTPQEGIDSRRSIRIRLRLTF